MPRGGGLVAGRNMEMQQDGSSPFQYSANGNLEQDYSKKKVNNPLEIFYRDDNLPFAFVYDSPDAIAGDGKQNTVYIAYDESGRRISKVTYNNLGWTGAKNSFSSGKEVHEAGSQVTEYNNLAGVGRTSVGAGNQFYLTDHLGSTREIYSVSTGTITYSSLYFPYGKQFGVTQTSATADVTEKFTGKEFDSDLGLNDFGARWYDPELGLWISPDAARQYFSLYTYGGNNPVNRIDPDGNWDKQRMDDFDKADQLNHKQNLPGQAKAIGTAVATAAVTAPVAALASPLIESGLLTVGMGGAGLVVWGGKTAYEYAAAHPEVIPAVGEAVDGFTPSGGGPTSKAGFWGSIVSTISDNWDELVNLVTPDTKSTKDK